MRIYCPKHPKQLMYTLWVSRLRRDLPKGSKKMGVNIKIDWVYCPKCKTPYKPKITFLRAKA